MDNSGSDYGMDNSGSDYGMDNSGSDYGMDNSGSDYGRMSSHRLPTPPFPLLFPSLMILKMKKFLFWPL